MERYKLKCGDSITLIKTMKDDFVDICFTSPPYNMKGAKTSKQNESKQKYCNEVEQMTSEEYYQFLKESIDEMLRVTKRLVVLNIQKNYYNKKQVLRIIGDYSEYIHDIIIWNKTNPMPSSIKHKITNAYEMFIILKKNPKDKVNINSESFKNVITEPSNNNRKYAKYHRAIMNINVYEKVLIEFIKPNDIVFDMLCGLSTTGVVALKHNCRYIGIDKEELYIKLSKERLKQFSRCNK